MNRFVTMSVPAHSQFAHSRRKRERGVTLVELVIAMAIIGVIISVGAYYSSVINNKNRINQTINAVTLMMGNIRSAFAPANSYATLTNTVANNMGIVYRPFTGSGANISTVWGGNVTIDGNADFFRIVLPMPDKETCIAMVSALAQNAHRVDVGSSEQALLTSSTIGTNGAGTVYNKISALNYNPATAATGCASATPTITLHTK